MSIAPLSSTVTATPALSGSAPPAAPANNPATPNVFQQLLHNANEAQQAADQNLQQLVQGQTDSLQSVIMSAAKADLSFRLLLEIRNRLIDSYQEIMRMQV